MKAINPTTGAVVSTHDLHTSSDIENVLSNAEHGYQLNKALTFQERASYMLRAREVLLDKKQTYGELITTEMGKPIQQAVAEIEKCAWACEYYAQNAESIMARETISESPKSYKTYLPIGAILAIMPWNFPFWQVFRFAAPALMAGNSGILKHASNVPGAALGIEEIFKEAGAPEGAFQTLLVRASSVADIIADERIKGVTLTGSEAAGSAVGALAGKYIKPSVMELGSNDAFIIMPSADLDNAVTMAVKARVQNNGQSCIAGKRFIVHQDIYEEFKQKFVAAFEALKIGDPRDPNTDIGPIYAPSGVEELTSQVEAAIKDGGKLLCGAKAMDGAGSFFSPGIIEDIPLTSPTAKEEIFGPVALLFKAKDFDEAIAIANDSPFGLGSAIFSTDEKEIETACNSLEAGATFVNSMVISSPDMPFGGVKRSGYGRELAAEGLRAFANLKSIFIA